MSTIKKMNKIIKTNSEQKELITFVNKLNTLHDKLKFNEIINNFEKQKRFGLSKLDLRANLLIGDAYRKTENHLNAFLHFKLATDLNLSSELASQCLYIELVKLGYFDAAIKELNRYLSKNAAKSYKTTIKELLNELKNGNALKFKNIINKYAKQYKINEQPSKR